MWGEGEGVEGVQHCIYLVIDYVSNKLVYVRMCIYYRILTSQPPVSHE